MASTNRRDAPARMVARNPMRRPETRAKLSEALRAIGHKPLSRGGNGMPLPTAQATILEALAGHGAVAEFVVRTGAWRGARGLPNHFKIDVALPARMIAVEIDGASHSALERQAQDARKEAFLSAHGWTVLRFSNRDVMERLAACVATVTSTTSKSPA